MATPTTIISVSLPKKIATELDKVARSQSMNRSEYIRALLRREFGFETLRNLQSEVSQQAPTVGMTSMRSAVQAVRAQRRKKV